MISKASARKERIIRDDRLGFQLDEQTQISILGAKLRVTGRQPRDWDRIKGMQPLIKNVVSIAAVIVCLPSAAWADDRADCAAGDGTLLTGVVIASPAFATGKSLRGIPLSHTHIRIRGDADGKTYDLAVDDVFAPGYAPQLDAVPAPLSSIVVGQHLEACGLPYAGGMHWVHTNCGAVPTAQDPKGWLKILDAAGAAGPNLENSLKYCYLWPGGAVSAHHRRRHKVPGSV